MRGVLLSNRRFCPMMWLFIIVLPLSFDAGCSVNLPSGDGNQVTKPRSIVEIRCVANLDDDSDVISRAKSQSADVKIVMNDAGQVIGEWIPVAPYFAAADLIQVREGRDDIVMRSVGKQYYVLTLSANRPSLNLTPSSTELVTDVDGRILVYVFLDPRSTQELRRLTSSMLPKGDRMEHPKRLAILVEGEAVSFPVIRRVLHGQLVVVVNSEDAGRRLLGVLSVGAGSRSDTEDRNELTKRSENQTGAKTGTDPVCR